MSAAVAVDVGGTTIKAAVITPDGIGPVRRLPTPRNDPDATVTARAVADLVTSLSGGTPAGVGLVAPGIVETRAGVVQQAANLGWVDVALRDLVAAEIGVPVVFGHDVRAGALAEWAAMGHDAPGPFGYVAVGTGVALAVLGPDGEPLTADPWSGEIGQIGFGADPAGTLESVASAAALARNTGQPDAEQVAAAVRAGDPVAVAAWSAAVDALATALAWTTVILAPRVIVVGGGLAESGALLLDPLDDRLRTLLRHHRPPALRRAVLGDLAACAGAALLWHRSNSN